MRASMTPSRIFASPMPSIARDASEVCGVRYHATVAVAAHRRKSVLLENLVLVLPLIGNQESEETAVLGDNELGASRSLEVAVVELDEVAWR